MHTLHICQNSLSDQLKVEETGGDQPKIVFTVCSQINSKTDSSVCPFSGQYSTNYAIKVGTEVAGLVASSRIISFG